MDFLKLVLFPLLVLAAFVGVGFAVYGNTGAIISFFLGAVVWFFVNKHLIKNKYK